MAILAKTPPMGFNTWNTFGPNISEQMVLEMADVMAEKGYRDAGYKYVVIDDCWSLRERDENGNLVADPEKFPHGMKYVGDYIHSKGLKFGMYSCAGIRTCAGYPASFDHEFQDARTFASWGVDFLKYDFCYFPSFANCQHRYLTMAQALRASGRDILFSACNWGVQEPWSWMRSVGAHMYRSTGDIWDNFPSTAGIMKSQMGNFNANAAGCFNDMDMLTVGMGGQGNVGDANCNTYGEYEMQFAYWCFCAAPLMMGADLRKVGEEYRTLLQHKELIRLNQDPECRPPYKVREDNGYTVFIRHLADGEFAIGVFNLHQDPRYAEITFAELGVPVNAGVKLALTDVITGESIPAKRDDLFVYVPGHSCKIFRAKFVRDRKRY
ncbi:MAG: glycoside hydrolase family 27 protein [Clostridia bacterium]|nr:glycoside hydrolase family 27 protein [Clostridia bacterium]